MTARATRGTDPFAPAVRADPFPCYARFRAAGDVQPAATAHTWLVSTDRAAREVLASPDVTHWRRPSPDAGDPFEQVSSRWTSAVLPGPHGVLRRDLHRVLGVATIDRVAAAQHVVAHHSLDTALRRGGMDAVTEYATPLALVGAAHVLGLTAAELRGVAELHLTDPGSTLSGLSGSGGLAGPAADGLAALLRGALADRGRSRDGLLGVLAHAVASGDVDRADAVPFARLFLFALVDNVVALIAGGIAALADDDDAESALRRLAAPGPDGAADVVEEVLRRDGPVQAIRVTATRDLASHGVVVPAGDDLLVLVASANHDPSRYDRPERLDPSRATADHLAFGWGRGYCVGARLARREAAVALSVLAARVSLHGPARYGPLRRRPEVTRAWGHVLVGLEPAREDRRGS